MDREKKSVSLKNENGNDLYLAAAERKKLENKEPLGLIKENLTFMLWVLEGKEEENDAKKITP